MSEELSDVFAISGSAMQAQQQRMKIIAENIANASATANAPGQKPYQRQVVTFKSEFDKAIGAYKVKPAGVQQDRSDPIKKFDPSNPVADAQGYVLMPNISPVLEMMDMSEASHQYQANMNMVDSARSMVLKTINILQ
jgi:flagellar basal-body rod protein FlgC